MVSFLFVLLTNEVKADSLYILCLLSLYLLYWSDLGKDEDATTMAATDFQDGGTTSDRDNQEDNEKSALIGQGAKKSDGPAED